MSGCYGCDMGSIIWGLLSAPDDVHVGTQQDEVEFINITGNLVGHVHHRQGSSEGSDGIL